MRKSTKEERWLMYPYRLAHHPICDKFKDHMYTIRGVKVCRGCFNLYLGQFIGIITTITVIYGFHVTFSYWFPFWLTYVLFTFTPLSVILEPPRPVKDFFRFLLGIAVISSYLAIILAFIELLQRFSWYPLIAIIALILTHIIARVILIPLRKKQNKAICESCEQYNLPRCDGMKYYYDRHVSLAAFKKGDAFTDDD